MGRFAAEIATKPPGFAAFAQVTISGFGSHGSNPPHESVATNGNAETTKPNDQVNG